VPDLEKKGDGLGGTSGPDNLGETNQSPDSRYLYAGLLLHFTDERVSDQFPGLDQAAWQNPKRLMGVGVVLPHHDNLIFMSQDGQREVVNAHIV
jgi:hypothetical protein